MKKLLCGVLALATVLPCAVACGGRQGGGDNGDGVTLEITAIDKGLGTAWLQQAAEDYNFLEGTNITVVPDFNLNASINEKVTAKGAGSDIYFTFSTELQWVEWYAANKLYDLDDIKGDIQYRNADYAKLGTFEGKRVIMPYAYSPTGFIYNQNYINEIPSHGAFTKGTFPTTWQGLLDMCDSINTKWSRNSGATEETKIYPLSYAGDVGDINYIFKGLWAQIDPAGFKAYYSQPALDNVNNDENKSLIVNNNVKQAMECIVKLINPQDTGNGYAPSNAKKNAPTMDNLTAQSNFINGYSVFTISGAWFEYEMRNQISEKWGDNQKPYHFAAAPIVNSGSQSTVFVNTPSEYFLIPKNGKNNNLTLAKNFLKYLAEPEQAQLFHATSGTPCSIANYNVSSEEVTPFQYEIAQLANSAQIAIGGSDSIASLSGAIGINFTNIFNALARSAFSTATIAEKLESAYAVQKEDWENCVGQF